MITFDLVLRPSAFTLGGLIVFSALLSAVRTFLLPRAAPDPITQFVFIYWRRFFNLLIAPQRAYAGRDRVMAYFGPTAILALLAAWLACVLTGYTLMFWSIDASVLGMDPWLSALTVSGSSIFTLGYAPVDTLPEKALTFAAAATGPILIALLIGYMPTLYGAFSKREALVNLLEVRAGAPPSATDLIIRYYRLHGINRIGEMWVVWEQWFSELEETHTSLPMLNFYRSNNPDHSWVTASGAVLDAAAMILAAVDTPPNVQANLCLRAGYIALRHIADYFAIPYNPDPRPDDRISVTRSQFEQALGILASEDVPLKPDHDQAWREWAGWRVNYDTVLLRLARLTMSPPAPWSSPEMTEQRRPPLTGRGS
jgi:hypothetical protein